jgi:Heparinase II/III-like protein/Heparinase II/III N-terminus
VSKLATMLQVGRTFGVRDGMLRLEYELRRGSGLMSWKMRSVQGWDSWDIKNVAPNVTAEEMLAARRDGTRQFFFGDARNLQSEIKRTIGPDGESKTLADAGRVLAGDIPFFDQLSFASSFPPQWFRNPATGQSVSPQKSWTQMRFASPDYGDLKFILEPSRFLFIYPLVRAYALTGDERFPRAFWNAMEDWAQHSPPMAGPLWICGQECALRILAWSFAFNAFIHSPSTTSARASLLVSMIAAHAWRTAQTVGYARSQRSNHLISEAVGLWTAGTLYPELRESQVWKNLGSHLLRDAVLDQITPQGVSQQHSFNYQRMILHLLLWTLRLAEIHDAPLHPQIRARAQAALDFMLPWIDPASGLAPNFGSNDGTLIFPLANASFRDFRPLQQLAAGVFGRPGLPPGPWDEGALWFGVKPASAGILKPTAQPSVDSGYFRLGNETSWALIRAGRYTRRPFQADQLHVDLWWQGINIARDAGTYLYNGAPPWNNGLARTAAHNTITVNGRDQMRRAGRFLWLDWAQASGESRLSRIGSSQDHPWIDYFAGEHDGYSRSGIKHRRRVQWLWGAGWAIVDDVEGTGVHDVRLHWLTADLPYEVSGSPFKIAFKIKQATIRWNIFSSAEGNPAVIRAGKQAWSASASLSKMADEAGLLGWESPTYGDLQPAISLLYRSQSQLPVRFVTVILTDERCHLKQENGQVAILKTESTDLAEIYRVELSPGSNA